MGKLTDSIHWRMKELNSYSDRIDSREVLERIEEIESEYLDTESGELITAPAAWNDDDRLEHAELTGLIGELRKVAAYKRQPEDGMFLTRESYLREYVAEWFADTWGGDWFSENPRTFKRERLTWERITKRAPFNTIDWDAQVEIWRSEHNSVEYDGVTFYVD